MASKVFDNSLWFGFRDLIRLPANLLLVGVAHVATVLCEGRP